MIRLLLAIMGVLFMGLFSHSASAVGFCLNGPFDQNIVFQRSSGSVAIPGDSSDSYSVVIEETSTYTGCISVGVIPTIYSEINSPFTNTGNFPPPSSVSLPAGFSSQTASRLQVSSGIHLQTFYAIEKGPFTRYCGLNGNVCSGALLSLDVLSSITFHTYTVITFDNMNNFIGSSINQSGKIGLMVMETGFLGSITVNLEATINYIFARSSCDLSTPSQTVTLDPAMASSLTPGSYVSATPFDIDLFNCVPPRSLSDTGNSFSGSLIRVAFLPASGQLVAGSTTDLRPLDQGMPGVAEGVAFQLRQRNTATPVTLDGQTTLTAPLGTRNPADTTETFELEAGLVKVNGETVTAGNVSSAVTLEVEYR